MNHISLFTGYGGMELGLRLAGIELRTVLYVEIEPYCQDIIKARIRDGHLDPAPIWNDIRGLDGSVFAGKVGIISGGFPCQPFSVAGKQRGESDERNLWPETRRIISEVGPEYCLLENVPNITTGNGRDRPAYGGTVLGDLAEMGYDIKYGVTRAADAGAPQLRNRLWILAHAISPGAGLEAHRTGR